MEKFTLQPKEFALKFKEYIKNNTEKPIKEGLLLKIKEEIYNKFIIIQAGLANDRVSRQINELIVSGISEELKIEREDVNPYDDEFYNKNIENGYQIHSAPIYDNNMQIQSHRYLRTAENLEVKQQELLNDISIKYEKEYDNKFYDEQEAKEAMLKEKVSAGEMTFIGEMPFDDYIELRKSSPLRVSGKNFELIPCFENDKIRWTNNRKVYAYINNETQE